MAWRAKSGLLRSAETPACDSKWALSRGTRRGHREAWLPRASSSLARCGPIGTSSSDDLTGDGEAEAAVGDEVDDEAAQACELGAVEDEHLGDEDPHEEAAHEPVIGGRPGRPEPPTLPGDRLSL